MRLSSPKVEILNLLALSYSVKEVARQAFLSPKSINSRKYRLMQKLVG